MFLPIPTSWLMSPYSSQYQPHSLCPHIPPTLMADVLIFLTIAAFQLITVPMFLPILASCLCPDIPAIYWPHGLCPHIPSNTNLLAYVLTYLMPDLVILCPLYNTLPPTTCVHTYVPYSSQYPPPPLVVKSNQVKSNQFLFKVCNVHLKEKKNQQEAIYPTIFYN